MKFTALTRHRVSRSVPTTAMVSTIVTTGMMCLYNVVGVNLVGANVVDASVVHVGDMIIIMYLNFVS